MRKVIALITLCMSHALFAEDLFTYADRLDNKSLPDTELSAAVVKVNTSLLTNQSKQMDIALPNGQKTTVVFDRITQHNKNKFSWFGHLKGHQDEQMVISSVNGFMSGAIYTKSRVFEITPHAYQQVRIAELATENFPECDGTEIPLDTVSHSPQHSTPVASDSTLGGTASIDVMVLYTSETRDAIGGVDAIEATAQAAVDAMNISFANSQTDIFATLSYTGLVNYDETGDSSTDLNWVTNSDAVAALRTAYGADMVSLLVESMSGCGRGYVMRTPGQGFASFAYQVTRRSCAVGNLSFAHEFGHNMGLEHNPANSGATPETASYPWSFGHFHSGSYRTVMSYSNPCTGGCTRRQYFSNPDVQFNDLDTGIKDLRDNARSLRETSLIVENFRLPANDTIFEDSFN